MSPHDVEKGQGLYLYTLDDNNEVSRQSVYVIDSNKSSIYFGYSKYDSKNSHRRVKVINSFPIMWKPSFIGFYYLSDDPNFGKRWSNDVIQRSRLRKDIKRSIDDLFYYNYDTDTYMKVKEALDGILK